MDIKKNLSKFLLLGVSALALGGFTFSNSETIKNTVDQQLFTHLEVTAFQNIEDARLSHLKNEIQNLDKAHGDFANLNIPYSMLKDNIAEPDYKEALRDKEFYNEDLATLKAVKDEFNAPIDMAKYAKDLPNPDLKFEEKKVKPVILKLEEYKPASTNEDKNKETNKVSENSNHDLQNYDEVKETQNANNGSTVNRTDFFANLKALKEIYLEKPSAENKNSAKI